MPTKTREGTGLLQRLVADKINELSGILLAKAGSRREDVDEMVVVGNTTMETLFASFHPHSLGVSPYLPPVRFPGNFRAKELGIDLNPGTNIHVFPVISGFSAAIPSARFFPSSPTERTKSS